MKQDETFKEKTESINPKKGIPQEADQEDASLTDQETENISGGLRPHILRQQPPSENPDIGTAP